MLGQASTLAPAPLYTEIDIFLDQYAACVLHRLDGTRRLTIADFSMSALAVMAADCRAFVRGGGGFLQRFRPDHGSKYGQDAHRRAAYDFWHVRSGDRLDRFPPKLWPQDWAALTCLAREFGLVRFYIGLTDHLIYQTGAED